MITVAVALSSCVTDQDKMDQLEQVAKDWSATIRASQVLPVYPVTEDVYPGDVFLVTTPIEEQTKLYKQKGFLPMDAPVARLVDVDFTNPYWGYYGLGTPSASNVNSVPPAVRWSFDPKTGKRRILPAGNNVPTFSGNLPGDITVNFGLLSGGSFLGAFSGNLSAGASPGLSENLAGNFTIPSPKGFTGNLTGSFVILTNGNISGEVSGKIDKYVTDNLFGKMKGNFALSSTGNFTGGLTGNLPALAGNAADGNVAIKLAGQANLRGLDATGNSSAADITAGWYDAPRAAFPSYSFSVQADGSFGLALPIQGVPVGLGLMGGGAATGTIELSDAYTYGLPLEALRQALEKWYAQHGQSLVEEYRGDRKHPYFLRVISRVYLIKGVHVSLISTEYNGVRATANITSANISGGNLSGVFFHNANITGGNINNANITGGNITGGNIATDNQLLADRLNASKQQLQSLNDIAGSMTPEGSLTFTSYSGRTVGMAETFAQPLVIGYLAFDFPIDEYGHLTFGAVSTFEQLEAHSPYAGYSASQLTPVESQQYAFDYLLNQAKTLQDKVDTMAASPTAQPAATGNALAQPKFDLNRIYDSMSAYLRVPDEYGHQHQALGLGPKEALLAALEQKHPFIPEYRLQQIIVEAEYTVLGEYSKRNQPPQGLPPINIGAFDDP